ncbi:MAG: XisI protein [Chloroflexi bacterium]|nr:XisI protein [Chloroflexota bacterium]
MDNLKANYPNIIKGVLETYSTLPIVYQEAENELVFDDTHGRYLLLRVGWQDGRRIYGVIIQLDLINDKIWIQQDYTETGVAYDLEAAGVPKQDIVLAFHEPAVRPHTGYAVA